MTDVLVVIVIFALLVELFSRVFFGGTNLAGAMGGLFTGLRADGWPQGVQEEDRDHGWGKGRGTSPAAEPRIHPALRKVQATTRPR
jgi:hypothetical protein